jgi:hypothetical protein
VSSGIEGIGQKFLLKLYEKTVNDGVQHIDRYQVGYELGLIDEQTDNLVNVLVSYGYLEKIGGRNIEISKEGRNKAEL